MESGNASAEKSAVLQKNAPLDHGLALVVTKDSVHKIGDFHIIPSLVRKNVLGASKLERYMIIFL